MSRYNEIPENYTVEEIENKLPFLKNTKIEDVEIKINKNNKLYWYDGTFYNGVFVNSYWHYGDFYNGKFINSYWDWGYFYNGKFINSFWEFGRILDGIFINSIIKEISRYNKFEDYSKAIFHNCIILEPKLLKLNRTYSKLIFKGVK